MKLRWKEFAVALSMAFVLWYGVTGSEKVESQVDVRVDYRGLPNGLVVRNGLVNKVSVRLRAPAGMLRTIASRDYAFFMDLSSVSKGENMLAVNMTQLPFSRGVEVMDVTPARIFLDVDTLESKTLPIEALFIGKLPPDFTATVTLDPPEAKVSGAAGLLEGMEKIPVRVPLEEQAVPGTTVTSRALTVPQGVDALPTETKVNLQIGIKRKQVKAVRQVQVSHAPAKYGTFVRPDKVTVTFSAPASQAERMASGKDAVRAFVDASNSLSLGSYTLPVRVSLPEGAELVSIEPARVNLTVEQKQPASTKKKN